MKYNPKLIAFFKKHNMYSDDMFDYFEKHSTMIDYDDPDQRCFVGCFPILDKNNRIIGIVLHMPYVNNEKTMLISVHELVHGYEIYQNFGKKYKKDITIEALPLLYERIYILENPSRELTEYSKFLDSIIDENSEKAYQFGLKIRNELLRKYYYNPKKMIKLIKVLKIIHKREYI